MKIKEIKKFISKLEDEKRLQHSLRVAKTAKKLAKQHGANVKKCVKAALLHDIGYFVCDDTTHIKVEHGAIGAQYCQKHLGIQSKKILQAIKYHTIGYEHFDKVGKIVFVADKIEPGRNYEEREYLYQACMQDLDQGLKVVLEHLQVYLESKGEKAHPQGMKLLKKLGGDFLKKDSIFDELRTFLDSKHAKDIEVIDLEGKSADFDAMVVLTALNKPHMQGLTQHVEDFLAEKGQELKVRAGKQESGWIVLDYGDFLVHLFDEQTRGFYSLERLWKDREN